MVSKNDESAPYWLHVELSQNEFTRLVHAGRIRFAGNRKLKIYGTLACASGERMKMGNRVLFSSEEVAREAGFRPCGRCMRNKYLEWVVSRDTRVPE